MMWEQHTEQEDAQSDKKTVQDKPCRSDWWWVYCPVSVLRIGVIQLVKAARADRTKLCAGSIDHVICCD